MRFPNVLEEAYRDVGVFEADIVYLYSDFRAFGVHVPEFESRNAFCDAVVEPLLRRGKTVLITTFTYTTEGRFDPGITGTKLGVMNKWILGAPGRRRSEHPIFSYAAIGPQAGDLVEGIGKGAFGHDSVFDRLYGRNAAFLYVGRPVWMGNTIIHHVEHWCGATYREHKIFGTEVYRGETYVGKDYSAFVRRRDVPGETFAFRFEEASARLFDKGLVRQVGNDRELTNISAHPYDATADFLMALFYQNPRIFI